MAQAYDVSYFGIGSLTHLWEKIKYQDSSLWEKVDASLDEKADLVSGATEGNFAGLNASGNLVDSGKKASDFATFEQGARADSAIQGVKVNGTALVPDSSIVDVLIAEGSQNGSIKVNNVDVSVHGLGSAAYEASTAFDAAGAAAAVLGDAEDTSTDNTVYGVKAYAKEYADSVVESFVDGLDSSKGHAQGADGIGVFVEIEDGKLKSVDASIKSGVYKTVQTAVADPTADGTGVEFIDSLSQDTNGVITPHKKSVAAVVASTSGEGGSAGLMTAAQAEKLAGIETDAEVNDLEGVQVNGSDLSIDGNKKVNITIAEGATNGTLAVNGVDVSVHGLGSAAYEDSTAFDASGAAATAKSEVIGSGSDASTANTIYGAKAYADSKKQEAIDTLIGSNSDASTANTIYGARAYTDARIAGLSAALVYKGSVANYTELLTKTATAKTGDVWNVIAAVDASTTADTDDKGSYPPGTNFAWTGSEWDPLGGAIDTSAWLTNDNFIEISESTIKSICV